MENQSNSGNQSRFLIAAALSMAVLFTWQMFFAPTPPPANTNANSNANVAAAAPTTAAPAQPAAATSTPPVVTNPDTTPSRTITIKSPLYEVKLDSKGAVASSWVILKNKSPKADIPVYADGSTDAEKKPLQLISQEALNRSPRELPFRIATDDAALNTSINERNYQIAGAEDTITLADGEQRVIEMTLTDGGVSVKKTFVFRGDSYVSDLGVTLTNNGQPVPNTRLLIGASIGDHAINNHTFYHPESEVVAGISGDIYRHQGNYSFTYDASNNATLTDKGSVDWAAVSDSYFAMVAVPATPATSVEYRASKYDVQTRPFFYSIFQWILRNPTTSETRHLVTAYLPINTDGSVTKVYTGTKDYFLLKQISDSSATTLGREVEITNVINFSSYSFLRWMIKPIAIIVLHSLNFFNWLTGNYGIAIIVFTFLFYMLLFPLRWTQSKSFKKASGNAPKMKEIQDKIKDLQKKGVSNDDPRMRDLQMQQLKMTKDALPIGGCLPMLLQFPLLIAFYTAVTVSLEVRQASFLWLPDLSAADPWHILEFAFALSMILSMKFTPQAAAITPEQQMQQKMMTYIMPIMMLWVMWMAPSGLLLYWFFGNIVSFGQQMVINHFNKPNLPPETEVVAEVPKGAKKVKPKLA